MELAIGVIETQGFPAILAVADAMVKAGRVTVAIQEQSESGRQHVTVRGPVSEVKRAVEAGLIAGNNMPELGEVTSHYIIPNPAENVVTVLPVHFTELSEPFRV
ncbi:MAG: carbon dioxide-concentrating mechanism protein CcmK [Leptolyngbyaceae bacterium]|nr:carbon dioxide-concentrating mechanism protein CcmK [Leptolyngbyaceae bacterium]